MSAIPPLGPGADRSGAHRARTHVAIQYDRRVLSFVVGLIVGASLVGLLTILIAPSRRVRAERPLPRDVETSLLLGQDPDAVEASDAPPEPTIRPRTARTTWPSSGASAAKSRGRRKR